jgi:hypothetical protein
MGVYNLKKIIPFVIMGILVLSGLGASALPSDKQTQQGSRTYTHTVFAEDGTATWCSHCPYAHESLWRIFQTGQKPLYYVALVSDKNTHAAARLAADQYNLAGYPTVYFDGGYKVNVGSYDNYQQQMSWYNSSITSCGSRTVPDIWTQLNVSWLGNAAMNIHVSVKNNDSTSYAGHLRVFVAEVQSSMGWIDTQGHKYTFPFLDYAYNNAITVASGNTWTNDISWDGHNYNDGYGHNFGSIQYGNIMILATVYNNTGHTQYSDPGPPPTHPFQAYYVDDCTGFWVGTNTPPNVPSNPNPANGATSVDVNKHPSWTGGDPDPTHDTVTYDVYFGTTSTPPKVASNQSSTSYNPGTLAFTTMYYWQIVAWDNHGATSAGPVWHFTTTGAPNNPPSAPTITGQKSGKANTQYTYTLVATDPDADTVQYYVDWGDGTNSGWTALYGSGVQVHVNHSWTVKGTYTITAKARDEHGAEGPTSTLSVTMPLSNIYAVTPLLEWLFARFPHAFPILRHLLGY